MDSQVTLPWGVFAGLVALAAVAVLDRVLFPGLRWYFRRRMNRVIEEINVRWQVDLPQFKLRRRQVLIDRLLHDARVQAAGEAYGREHVLPATVVARVIERYAGEIVPAFNAFFYYRVGYTLAKAFARLLYRVRLGFVDAGALAAINPRSTVVFVMNHRSNMDYVLVAFLAAERVALSYAVGECGRCRRWCVRWGPTSCAAIPAIRSTARCSRATCIWRPRPASRRRCFPRTASRSTAGCARPNWALSTIW